LPTSCAPAIVLDAPLAGGVHVEPSARPVNKEKHKLRKHSTAKVVDYLMAKKKEADYEKDLKE
jgi:hypothetical protein